MKFLCSIYCQATVNCTQVVKRSSPVILLVQDSSSSHQRKKMGKMQLEQPYWLDFCWVFTVLSGREKMEKRKRKKKGIINWVVVIFTTNPTCLQQAHKLHMLTRHSWCVQHVPIHFQIVDFKEKNYQLAYCSFFSLLSYLSSTQSYFNKNFMKNPKFGTTSVALR